MNDFQTADKNEIITNIRLLHDKLAAMIPKQPPLADLDVVELEISGMMHEMSFFRVMVEILYPLEKAYYGMLSNPMNTHEPNTIEKFVQSMDFNLRKSFLTVTQFNLETLLGVIVTEHEIKFSDDRISLTAKYMEIMKYFEIEHGEYENLLKTYHFVRNTLHAGTKIKKDFGPHYYKGCTFEAKKGQDYIKFADWRHFTWFTSEVLNIFVAILESKKYKFRDSSP